MKYTGSRIPLTFRYVRGPLEPPGAGGPSAFTSRSILKARQLDKVNFCRAARERAENSLIFL